ncbi:MAG: hypothetical protein CL670_07215 [Balneola sp.]|jgi:hypothetical protein|nr:hypothetical protein [Balneola sp.]MBE78924.1 hypothetical protein [Balneola sp.]HBX67279.1 hypothetical protein [Balneolaceae bacterium]|tara:strand:+ start:610 stop:1335 length:726 start_codon:yes stop_codon:yes gene_type:complete
MDKKEFHRQKREIERSEDKHKALKLKSSFVPGGTKVYDAFTALVQPTYEKRKDEWLNILMYDLVRRQEDGLISLEELSKNEEFVTIVTKATLLAQQNHQKEKIEALKNIVLNSTEWLSKGKPIFDWSHRFLMIVDEISPLHILLLKTFQYPKKAAKEKGVRFDEEVSASNKDVFFKIYPEYKDRSALVSQCWKELESYGLFAIGNFSDAHTSEEMPYLHTLGQLKPQTTDFGNKFLDMIEE